ncbi:hypothetical protein GCM10025868_00970 [Angustibacter aerolatus]|uniref:ANTAR domain-containing protein n=1 Tax=Angustibacter aerolatus TaxID=1162965 RepID=A0ABQ6JAP3_9ACTN|nr:ANTAR domain-containing protein [Angustibacter aerolatus]GMA84847.1 hypothetical protein GCM10025868_00970 [Angustibacter aerolatus]
MRGMAGYRLLVDDRKVGALNLFSDTVGAFDEAAGDTGALLAAFATAALTSASDHDRAETLTRGLESNREIGVAVGLLMAAHGITSDQAFGVMRRLSSE